jgi:thioredoxin reductase (NADPH)
MAVLISFIALVVLLLASNIDAAKRLHNVLARLHGGADSSNDNDGVADEIRDVVIIGSGPAGCTAAIYTGRAMLRPLLIAGYMAGGQLMLTSDVENFPGYRDPVSGPMMMDDLKHQAIRFGAEFWQTNVQSVNLSKEPYEIVLSNCTVKARTIIISTGAEALWLNSENEEEFKGKGISTCATCDGYMFRNKPVIVIGGGDSAMEEANFLTRFASEVTLIHRKDSFRASKVMIQRAYDNKKIKIKTNQKVVKWLGSNGILSGVIIENTADGSRETLHADGAFIAIGHKPNTEFLKNQLKLTDNGYIALSEHTMTSIPGVFACGDVVDSRYRQAITAAGSGCQAAIDAERYLETKH